MTRTIAAPDGYQAHLLIVDDDPEIRRELRDYLCAHGFRATAVSNGAEAQAALSANEIDVLLLDLWLGNENGFDVLRRLRQSKPTPCIMVTAQDDVADKIVGLELGADDYLIKPVNLRELVARIRALIRRSTPADPVPQVPAGNHDAGSPAWKFDAARRSLNTPDGTNVPLTTAECDLLIELVANEGLPQSREDLCRRVFNREWNPYDRSLDSVVVKLRRKIEPKPDDPLVIKTVRGRGYVFTGFVR